jgi:predicted hydrocarbon binding protein
MGAGPELPAGQLMRDGIRYVMMRPDVLMGVARELSPENAALFFRALEDSTFRHAQASFLHYRSHGGIAANDFLPHLISTAAGLGWGIWSSNQAADGSSQIDVHDSPFAAGYGPSQGPVCSPITGVLKAMALVLYGAVLDVREVECAAQGSSTCHFRLASARR